MLVLLGGPGCTGFQYLAAGATTSTSSNPGRTGGALEAATGVSLPNREARSSPITIAGGARIKITEHVQQLAPLLGVDVLPDLGSVPLVPLFGAGIQPLHAGVADARFDFGMGSPHAHLGVFYTPVRVSPVDGARFDLFAVLLLLTAEYDIRFTSPPSEPYFTVSLGVGHIMRIR